MKYQDYQDQTTWSQKARDFADYVGKFTYKPNTQLVFGIDVNVPGQFVVCLFTQTEDSTGKRNHPIEIRSGIAVSDIMLAHNDSWNYIITDCVTKFELHERDEWLRYNGKMLRDPHASPS